MLGAVGDLQHCSGWPSWRLVSVAPTRGVRPWCHAGSTSSRRARPDPVLVIDPWGEDSPDWFRLGVNPNDAPQRGGAFKALPVSPELEMD